MNGGVGGSSSEAVTWIALHWQRSRGRRRRRSGRWRRRPTPTDRQTDRGRLPQRMSEGLVGAGNRCGAAAAAAEAVASPESRQTDRLLLLSVRPSVFSLPLPVLLAFLSSLFSADRPTDRRQLATQLNGGNVTSGSKLQCIMDTYGHPPHAQSIFLQCVIRDI